MTCTSTGCVLNTPGNEPVMRHAILLIAPVALLLAGGCATPPGPGDQASPHVPRGYHLVWNDEFDGVALDRSKWGFPGYKEREEALVNTEGTVVVDGQGHLVLSTFQKDDRIHCAILDTRGRYEPRYGYFEARVRFQKMQGHHGCFWLQTPTFRAAEDNPAVSGTEMDIIEWFGEGRRKGWAGMNIYYAGTNAHVRSPSIPRFDLMGGPVESDPSSPVGSLADAFHVYGLLWAPETCVFTCDGVEIMRDTQSISAVPQYIVLSLLSAQWERARLDTARLPDPMTVDYVRVYKPGSP